MASKLTDLNILVLHDDDRIQFKTPVTVTKDGHFNTTIPEEAVKTLEKFDLEMLRNRVGIKGHFSNTTLKGLEEEIYAFVRECVSRELVEDKIVIKYRVITKVAYVLDKDGEIIPNGYWCKDREDFNRNGASWREGTANRPGGMGGFTPTLSVYARPFHKKTYSYKSGRTVTKYENVNPERACSRGNSIDWLASQVNIVPNDTFGVSNAARDVNPLPEVDATEETALLFVNLIKLIDKANELLSGLNDPQNVLAYLAANASKFSQLTV